jgi:hypothetical protein
VVVFRELRVDGELVEIAAVDDLPATVRVATGRLPRACDDRGCEVIQIGRGGAARLVEGDVDLRRVGVAKLLDPALFGDISAASANAANAPKLLLAPSVQALERVEALSPFYRIYSWVSPLRIDGLHTWDIDRVLAGESRAQGALSTDTAFRLSGPDTALLDAEHRGSVAGQRFVLIGGETSALLLGFALIAAIGMRRGLISERRRLLARGARRWQVVLACGAEISATTLAGAVVGVAAGVALVAGIANRAGVPAGAVISHGIFTTGAVSVLVVAWLVTTLLLIATILTEDRSSSRRVGLADVAAAGATATIAVALSRGALQPSSGSGNTILFLILPVLVCFVAATVIAHVVGPSMRAAERSTRTRSLPLRLAVLALARAPGRTIASCAFVAVALGLSLFAISYRGTLDRGAADQAAFAVPLDFTVREGSALVGPLDVAPPAAYDRLLGGASAYPVLRLSATTPGPGASVLSPSVLGVPADAIRRLRWRDDFSSLPLRTIADRVAEAGEPSPAVLPFPAGATDVAVRARAEGRDVDVALVLADRRGRVQLLRLGGLHRKVVVLKARIQHGLSLLGLQLALPLTEQFFLAHRETEGAVAAAPAGMLDLGALRVTLGSGERRVLTNWRRWSLPSGGRVRPTRGGVQIAFVFRDTGGRLVFRPGEPTDGRSMPVVVSPDLAAAAAGGKLTLDFHDVGLAAHVVGVAKRLPTVLGGSGPFVLADSRWLSTAMNVAAPGEGMPNEVWVAAADERAAAAALHRPPFSRLEVASRAADERRLASDPLARATAVTLAAAAVVAMALALLGFWIGVAGELHDERSDFFDLEAQGVPPDRLRAQLRARATILLTLALAGGIGIGALLSRLVVSFVRISATTAVPEPPLRFDPPLLTALLAVVVLATVALLIVEGTSHAAFRRARPERSSWSLE